MARSTGKVPLTLALGLLTSLHPKLVAEALLLADALDLERDRIHRLLQVLDAPLIER